MKISNPIVLLIIMVCINAILLVAVSLGIKAQIPQSEEKTRLLILCALSFLSTAFIAVAAGSRFINSFVEPMEIAASKILAVLDTEKTKGQPEKEIADLTADLVTELETSRQRERLIADYSSDILCSLDERRRFLDLNIQSELVWRYPIISLLATPLDTLVCADDKDDFLQYFEACKQEAQSKPLECRVLARTGKLIDLEWQVEWSPSSQQYFCLAKNITDRKENQRLKAEITAMVGHDLRAPVSSLSFLLENLRAGTFGELPEDVCEKIDKARDNVGQMLNLINQLLDAEKLEGGQMEVELRVIPLSELYESCQDLLGDLAQRSGVELQFPLDSTSMAMADFDRSLQILCNLVSNAIKWSPKQSSIVVSEKIDSKFVTVSVADKGPGIPKERQQAIFERFKSIDQRKEKTITSSGLGLYIAKKLVELQGGLMGLVSSSEEGSTFSFSMKIATQRDLPGYLDK